MQRAAGEQRAAGSVKPRAAKRLWKAEPKPEPKPEPEPEPKPKKAAKIGKTRKPLKGDKGVTNKETAVDVDAEDTEERRAAEATRKAQEAAERAVQAVEAASRAEKARIQAQQAADREAAEKACREEVVKNLLCPGP